jgi:hypothetical protein
MKRSIVLISCTDHWTIEIIRLFSRPIPTLFRQGRFVREHGTRRLAGNESACAPKRVQRDDVVVLLRSDTWFRTRKIFYRDAIQYNIACNTGTRSVFYNNRLPYSLLYRQCVVRERRAHRGITMAIIERAFRDFKRGRALDDSRLFRSPTHVRPGRYTPRSLDTVRPETCRPVSDLNRANRWCTQLEEFVLRCVYCFWRMREGAAAVHVRECNDKSYG